MKLTSLLYPHCCPVCERVLPEHPGGSKEWVCRPCNEKLSYIVSPRCMICGKQLYQKEHEYCADCQKIPHVFTQGIGVFGYDEAIQHAMYRFKYEDERHYAQFFAEALYTRYGYRLSDWGVEVLLPVPLYPLKFFTRGYNQAELICQALSQISQIPVDSTLLCRVRPTKPMKDLNDEERAKNLENAFQCSANKVKYKKVLVMDDIYTTGATMDACARALKAVGVEKIYCASICIGNGY